MSRTLKAVPRVPPIFELIAPKFDAHRRDVNFIAPRAGEPVRAALDHMEILSYRIWPQ